VVWFPGEQRKTIYRYEKQPGMIGDGFFTEILTHVGASTRIHRRIFIKACALSIKSSSSK
jgi:hypothetical protein